MNVGVPLREHRVAPRCTAADALLLIGLRRQGAPSHRIVRAELDGVAALLEAIRRHRVGVLVCGGITRAAAELVEGEGVRIIDNVAGSVAEILESVRRGNLYSGYGLAAPADDGQLDCLACPARRCEHGLPCTHAGLPAVGALPAPWCRRLLAAAPAAAEREQRGLCRLAALLRLCLDLGLQRVGLAYCVDLRDAAEVVAGVLRGVVEVVPVCCAVRRPSSLGESPPPAPPSRCNPALQAAVLNQAETQLNVAVGLCLGADTVFAAASRAPVTTLVVRDPPLAHNPLAALYSDHYLRQCCAAPDDGHEPSAGGSGPKPG